MIAVEFNLPPRAEWSREAFRDAGIADALMYRYAFFTTPEGIPLAHHVIRRISASLASRLDAIKNANETMATDLRIAKALDDHGDPVKLIVII